MHAATHQPARKRRTPTKPPHPQAHKDIVGEELYQAGLELFRKLGVGATVTRNDLLAARGIRESRYTRNWGGTRSRYAPHPQSYLARGILQLVHPVGLEYVYRIVEVPT